MSLPFSADAFFEVFASYNRAWWPAALALWLVAAVVVIEVARAPRPGTDRAASVVLMGLWVWGGVVYHGAYFAAINPAARVFAVLFVLQGAILGWTGLVRGRLTFGVATGVARAIGLGLALYALAYPGLTLLLGHRYPAAPTFGVPCPTTILTVGLLLTSRCPPPKVIWIPLAWSLIGGSAAVLLGVAADYVLLACAPILAANTLWGGRAAR
jgi:hypothetical protein